jgi:hypothetical protein
VNKTAQALFWAVREAEEDFKKPHRAGYRFHEAKPYYLDLMRRAVGEARNEVVGKMTLDQAIQVAIDLAHEDNLQTETQLRMALWEHYGERAGPKN